MQEVHPSRPASNRQTTAPACPRTSACPSCHSWSTLRCRREIHRSTKLREWRPWNGDEAAGRTIEVERNQQQQCDEPCCEHHGDHPPTRYRGAEGEPAKRNGGAGALQPDDP